MQDFVTSHQGTQTFMEMLQDALIKRELAPFGVGKPLVVEFTQDPGLLHQYHRLRSLMDEEQVANDNIHDGLSTILVVRRGLLCLGGCRITLREGDENWPLPMESDKFNLRAMLLAFPLGKVRHAEISGLAVMRDCGEPLLLYRLAKAAFDKAVASDVHYLFMKSSTALARKWRAAANGTGVETTHLLKGVTFPENPNLPEVKCSLTISDLSSYCHDEVAEALEKVSLTPA